MVHAYLDDSGTHDGAPCCIVAGYFGSEQRWRRFDSKWRSVLDAFGVEEFHANRFWPAMDGKSISEYQGWSKKRCDKFVGDLLNIIQDSERIFPVSCAILMGEWKKLGKDERAFLTGAIYDESGNLLSEGAPKKPYFLAFVNVLDAVLSHCNPGQTVNFSCDNSLHLAGYAEKYFTEMKSWGKGKFGRMGEISFADSKKTTPIQAADLLAYETYQYAIARSRTRVVKPTRILAAAIWNLRNTHDGNMYDKEGIDLALKKFRSAKQEA